jgi:hypothetical protein
LPKASRLRFGRLLVAASVPRADLIGSPPGSNHVFSRIITNQYIIRERGPKETFGRCSRVNVADYRGKIARGGINIFEFRIPGIEREALHDRSNDLRELLEGRIDKRTNFA